MIWLRKLASVSVVIPSMNPKIILLVGVKDIAYKRNEEGDKTRI